jgi:hypothetical protein
MIPTLSICIPTYNRLTYLRVALESILPQLEAGSVELIVSDNCSTDGTPNYISELSSNFPSFRYIIQDHNVGLERNMIAAILASKGKFILSIGDDDVLLNGSIKLILDSLKDSDLLILNGWHTDDKLNPHRMLLPECLQGQVILDPAEAFSLLWDKMPLGTFVASNAAYSRANLERFMGTSHPYTGAVWDSLALKRRQGSQCNISCMRTPTVLVRGGIKSWSQEAAVIILHEVPRWFSLIQENSLYHDVAGGVKARYIQARMSVYFLLELRSAARLTRKDLDIIGSDCTQSQKLKLKFVASVPPSIANLIRVAYNKLSTFSKFIYALSGPLRFKATRL